MDAFIAALTSFIVAQIITAVILTEALTELAVKSELFNPFRQWLFESNNKLLRFIHRIFDCGYCFSVWASAASIVCVFYLDCIYVKLFVLWLLIHRLSNMFHFLMDAMRDAFRQ